MVCRQQRDDFIPTLAPNGLNPIVLCVKDGRKKIPSAGRKYDARMSQGASGNSLSLPKYLTYTQVYMVPIFDVYETCQYIHQSPTRC